LPDTARVPTRSRDEAGDRATTAELVEEDATPSWRPPLRVEANHHDTGTVTTHEVEQGAREPAVPGDGSHRDARGCQLKTWATNP
jgi:hypothetical protein